MTHSQTIVEVMDSMNSLIEFYTLFEKFKSEWSQMSSYDKAIYKNFDEFIEVSFRSHFLAKIYREILEEVNK